MKPSFPEPTCQECAPLAATPGRGAARIGLRRSMRLALLSALTVFTLSIAGAAPRAVEPFSASTWAGWQGGLAQPAVIVFTSTDCVHCPAVLERLAQAVRERRPRLPAPGPASAPTVGAGAMRNTVVIAVVIDAAPGEADAELLARPHYRAADRLFAFAGPSAPLRFGVNPSWRGVTPYVAFLQPGRPPRWITGAPSDADFDAWWAAR